MSNCHAQNGRRPCKSSVSGLIWRNMFSIFTASTSTGKVVLRQDSAAARSPCALLRNLPPLYCWDEASNGAHYWARLSPSWGHDVRLISPQFVTPYVKSNKNDRNEAEAI